MTGGITAGGTLNVNGFDVTNVVNIGGSVKTSVVNDLLTSVTASVVDSNIPMFTGTTGRVLGDSGILSSNITQGPTSATDNAIARFDSTTGKLIQNSTVTISDDAKIAANGCVIDMSTGGVINLVAGGAIQVNGSTISTAITLASYVQGPTSATNNRLAAFDLATGKLIKDSGILSGDVALGPASATDNAIARFNSTTGKLVKNSTVTISDDAKFAAVGGVIDMSVPGTIDFQATNVLANGDAFLTGAILDDYTKGPVGAVDNNIASFDLATGKLLKDSGISAALVVSGPASATDNAVARFDSTTGKLVQNSAVTISDDAKIAANSNVVDLSAAGVLNLVSSSVQINGSAAAKVSDLATYVQGPASAVGDNIATYNLATGKLIKDSGVAIGAIAAKLPLAGGSMSGNINMGTNNLTNVGSIVGAANSSTVDNLVSCNAVSVVDSDVPVFNGTTGRLLKSSGLHLTSFAVGATSATDNAVTRFDGITGKLVQNSAVTISDDAKIAATGGTIDMSFLGTIDLQATNVNVNGSAIATASSLASYVQGPASSTNDNIATYNLATGKLIKDSGVAIGAIAAKLPLAGGTMSGAIAMATNNITNIGSISGAVKTSAVDSIVTSSATVAVDSDIAIFDSTTGKIIKNSSVQVSSIAAKLPLAGGTMSGSIAMGGFNLTNCALITFPSNNVSLGVSATGGSAIAIGSSGTTASAANTIAIGTACAASLQYAVSIGNTCNSSGSHALSFGGGSLGITNPQADGIAIGSDITLGAGSNGIALGNAASIGTVSNAIAIGTGASNSIASSCLIGNTTIANIRPNSTGTCDLGTTGARFKDVLLSGSISGATNTRTADNIVSNTGAGVVGSVATFSNVSGKIIQDGGVLLSALLTSATAASTYLPLAGGTMTGALAMGSQEINGIAALRPAGNSIIIGQLATGTDSSVVAGYDSHTTSTLVGDIAIGPLNNVTGNRSIAIGFSNTIAADGAVAIGNSLTHAQANTILLGNNSVANIRAGATTCDIGTITEYFNTIYLGGSVSGLTYSRTADNIVSNAGAGVAGNLATFSGATGKIVQDSGIAVSVIATKLPLAGGTMSGSIAMATNNITNIGSISGAVKTSAVDSIVTSSATVAVDSDIAIFDSTTGKIVKNSSVQISSIAAKLPLAGGTMSGSIAMGGFNVTNIGSISGATNTRTADNIVSNAGASVDARVATFSGTTGKIVQDGGVLLSALLTSATAASTYLPLVGGVMSGSITGITQLGVTNGSGTVIIGTSNTNGGGLNGVIIGPGAVTTTTTGLNVSIGHLASAAGSAVAIGDGATASGSAAIAIGSGCSVSGPHNTGVGAGTTVSGAGGDSTAFGFFSSASVQRTSAFGSLSNASADSSSAFGFNCQATNSNSFAFGSNTSATAAFSLAFGSGLTNSTANSTLIGESSHVNIRAASTTCDLGTVALPFQTLYLNSSISGPTNTRTADNIVSNTGASVSGNIASLSGTTGKIITDSGVAAASVVVGPASATTGNLVSYNGTTGKLVADSGIVASLVVTDNTGTATAGRVATYASNKIIQDSGTLLSDLLTSATAASTYLALAGGTMTGDITIGAHNVTGTSSSTITGGTFASLASTDSTTTGTGAFTTPGGIGILKNITAGGTIKSTSTVNATTTSTGSIITAGGMGIAKDIFSAGRFVTSDTTGSTTTGNGSIVTGGGIGCGKDINVGGIVNVGRVDSASALNLGTSSATSVSIGKAGVITNITGSPPSLGKFATTGSTSLTGVTTVQNPIGSGVGSLVYAANSTYAGTVIRYRIWGLITNSGINTASINININGSSAVLLIWSPGTVTNAVFTISGVLSVQTSNAVIDITADVNPVGGTTITLQRNASLPTWDKTISNTLAATIQFSNAGSNGTVYHTMFETMFD
jgi:hypothetical protein